jgi:hypothetical protein
MAAARFHHRMGYSSVELPVHLAETRGKSSLIVTFPSACPEINASALPSTAVPDTSMPAHHGREDFDDWYVYWRDHARDRDRGRR